MMEEGRIIKVMDGELEKRRVLMKGELRGGVLKIDP